MGDRGGNVIYCPPGCQEAFEKVLNGECFKDLSCQPGCSSCCCKGPNCRGHGFSESWVAVPCIKIAPYMIGSVKALGEAVRILLTLFFAALNFTYEKYYEETKKTKQICLFMQGCVMILYIIAVVSVSGDALTAVLLYIFWLFLTVASCFPDWHQFHSNEREGIFANPCVILLPRLATLAPTVALVVKTSELSEEYDSKMIWAGLCIVFFMVFEVFKNLQNPDLSLDFSKQLQNKLEHKRVQLASWTIVQFCAGLFVLAWVDWDGKKGSYNMHITEVAVTCILLVSDIWIPSATTWIQYRNVWTAYHSVIIFVFMHIPSLLGVLAAMDFDFKFDLLEPQHSTLVFFAALGKLMWSLYGLHIILVPSPSEHWEIKVLSENKGNNDGAAADERRNPENGLANAGENEDPGEAPGAQAEVQFGFFIAPIRQVVYTVVFLVWKMVEMVKYAGVLLFDYACNYMSFQIGAHLPLSTYCYRGFEETWENWEKEAGNDELKMLEVQVTEKRTMISNIFDMNIFLFLLTPCAFVFTSYDGEYQTATIVLLDLAIVFLLIPASGFRSLLLVPVRPEDYMLFFPGGFGKFADVYNRWNLDATTELITELITIEVETARATSDPEMDAGSGNEGEEAEEQDKKSESDTWKSGAVQITTLGMKYFEDGEQIFGTLSQEYHLYKDLEWDAENHTYGTYTPLEFEDGNYDVVEAQLIMKTRGLNQSYTQEVERDVMVCNCMKAMAARSLGELFLYIAIIIIIRPLAVLIASGDANIIFVVFVLVLYFQVISTSLTPFLWEIHHKFVRDLYYMQWIFQNNDAFVNVILFLYSAHYLGEVDDGSYVCLIIMMLMQTFSGVLMVDARLQCCPTPVKVHRHVAAWTGVLALLGGISSLVGMAPLLNDMAATEMNAIAFTLCVVKSLLVGRGAQLSYIWFNNAASHDPNWVDPEQWTAETPYELPHDLNEIICE